MYIEMNQPDLPSPGKHVGTVVESAIQETITGNEVIVITFVVGECAYIQWLSLIHI